MDRAGRPMVCDGPGAVHGRAQDSAGSIESTLGRGVTVARSALDRLVQVRILAAQLSSPTVRPDAVTVRADDFALGNLSPDFAKGVPGVSAYREFLAFRLYVVEIHHAGRVSSAAIGTGLRLRFLKDPSQHPSVLLIPRHSAGAVPVRVPFVVQALVFTAAVDAVRLEAVPVCSVQRERVARLLQSAGRAPFHTQDRRTEG